MFVGWSRIFDRKSSLDDDYTAIQLLEHEDERAEDGLEPARAHPIPRWQTQGTASFCSLQYIGTLLVVAFASLFLGILIRGRAPTPQAILARPLLKTVSDNGAGLGSAVAQLRRSAVAAMVLDREFWTVRSHSAHGYDSIELLNRKRPTTLTVEFGNTCSLSKFLTHDEYRTMTSEVCHGMDTATARERWPALASLDDCGVVLDDHEWSVDYGFSVCTWKWLSDLLGHCFPRRTSHGTTSVGLHIRYGDMAGGGPGNDKATEWRTIPIPTAARILVNLERCLGKIDVRIYMEDHNLEVLTPITQKFDIVDTHDDLADLLDLASNDILIVSGSGYTEMAHQISRGGLTVVPTVDPTNRVWNGTGTNSLLRYIDLSEEDVDCSKVKKVLQEGTDRSREFLKRN